MIINQTGFPLEFSFDKDGDAIVSCPEIDKLKAEVERLRQVQIETTERHLRHTRSVAGAMRLLADLTERVD